MKNMNFEPSIDTQSIVKYLLELADNAPERIINYNELSQIIGKSIQKNRHFLESARRILMRDYAMVYGVVRGEGIKLISGGKIVDCVGDRQHKVNRFNKKSGKILSCAEFDKLSQPEKNKALTLQATIGAMQLMTSYGGQNKLSKTIGTATAPVDVKRVIDIFKKA